MSRDQEADIENVSEDQENISNIGDNENQNKEEVLFYGQRQKNDIRLVLVGRTGSGKSATGNTILTKKEFKSKASGSSITEQCQLAENRSNGYRFLVVDTPGLFDTKLPYGEVTKEIIRCIHMSTPGPHAFLLVLRLDRFTEEELNTFSSLFEVFGEKMSSFAIIVFTRMDDLDAEDTSIEEFINSSNEHLKNFITKVDGRYVAINNRGNDEHKRQQVTKLTNIVEELIQKNDGKFYTNRIYEEAEANLRQQIMEVERKKELEKKREVEVIESRFKVKMSEIETSNKLLEDQIKKQTNENATIQFEKEKTQEAIKEIQNELKQIDKEHQKELYHAKQETSRIEEKRMTELKMKEEQNQRQMMEMAKKFEDMKNHLQIVEKERQTAIEAERKHYQLMMENKVKTVIVESYTSQIDNLEKTIDDLKKEKQSLHNKNETTLRESMRTKQELLSQNETIRQDSMRETKTLLQQKEKLKEEHMTEKQTLLKKNEELQKDSTEKQTLVEQNVSARRELQLEKDKLQEQNNALNTTLSETRDEARAERTIRDKQILEVQNHFTHLEKMIKHLEEMRKQSNTQLLDQDAKQLQLLKELKAKSEEKFCPLM